MFRHYRLKNAIKTKDGSKLRRLLVAGWVTRPSYLSKDADLLQLAIEYLNKDAVLCLLEAGHPICARRGLGGGTVGSIEETLIEQAERDVDLAIEVLELLVRHGLRLRGVVNEEENTTALMEAASWDGLEKLITRMIDLGADPNEQNADGYTALFFCINSTAHIEALLRGGADPHIRDKRGLTAEESARAREAISGMVYDNTDICGIAARMGRP